MAASSDGYAEFVKLASAEFKKGHPDIDIVVEDFPAEAYKTALQVGLAGSNPPDVFFNWAGDDAVRLVRGGRVLDITDLGKQADGFIKQLSPGWLASFQVDGKYYGVPTDGSSKYFYYNKTFFARNKLTPPTDFDELLGLCSRIRQIDSRIVPLPLGNSERWKLDHYVTMLNERMMGVDALAKDYDLSNPEDKLFTDSGYLDAWNRILALSRAGCFQAAPNATSPQTSRTMFSSQDSPMIYCGTWCAAIFDKAGFTDYALFRMPPIKGTKSDAGANFLMPEGLDGRCQEQASERGGRLGELHRLRRDGRQACQEAESDPLEPQAHRAGSPILHRAVQVDGRNMAGFTKAINRSTCSSRTACPRPSDAGVEILNGMVTPSR